MSGQVSDFFIFDIVDDDCTFCLTDVNFFLPVLQYYAQHLFRLRQQHIERISWQAVACHLWVV